MTALPPPIVRDDLLERTRDRVRERLAIPAGEPVPAEGLIRIFAGLAETAAARIDGALEKNRLAFLDLVGVRQAPPRAARVPLTFTAAQGAPAAVRVPAGTVAAAPPAPGESDPVLYQTGQELTVAPAALTAVWTREPARDRVADLTADVAGPGGATPRDPFAGDRVPERRLILGCGPLLALAPRQLVTLRPADAGPNGEWLAAVSWSWWDGSDWRDLTSLGGGPQAVALSVPEVPETELAGRRGRWLGAALHTSVPHARLGVQGAARTTAFSTAPDAACADDQPLDLDAPIAPFGPAATAAVFSLAAADAFDKPGARVTLSVVPAEGAGTAGEPPPALDWEYSDGRSLPDLVDTTVGLTTAGEVGFTVPADWVPETLGGRRARWLHARLKAGAFVGAPRLATLSADVTWTLPRIASVSARATADSPAGGLPPDAALSGAAPVDPSADFKPLGDGPAPGATFLVACDEAVVPPPPGVTSKVTLAIGVTPRTGTSQAPTAVLAWEFWDGGARAWTRLGTQHAFTDTTKALMQDGTVSFVVPPSLAAAAVAGRSHRWVRVRLASGDYGKEATYVPSATSPSGFTLQASTLAPPSIASLRFSYTRASGSDVDADVLVRSDAGLHPRAGGAFEPFPPMEAPDPALHLGFASPLPNAALTLYVDVDQHAGRDGRLLPPAVAWEYWDGERWARLAARDETRGLTRSGTVTFVAAADLARRDDFGVGAWWVRARRAPGPPSAGGRVRALLVNTTWAVEGTGVALETLGSSTGEPGLRLTATRTPVLDGEVLDVLEPDLPPAGERSALGPDAIGPQQATGVWVRWARVTDFVTSGPRDRHYTLDPVSGVVEFGDGRRGLVPPPARAGMRLRYRAGGGARGNRAVGEITELKTAVPYVEAVTNHVPATGGSDVESLASVGMRGPRMLRHGGRAIAAVDVEDLAAHAAPAVARTLAIPATGTENAGRVGLVIVPEGGGRPDPGAALLAAVRAELEARLPATAELWVSGPGWVQVTVSTTLTATSLEVTAEVQAAAAARLTEYLHPLTGGTGGAGWPFGRVPHESDLIAVLEALPGVEHVEHLSLERMEIEPPPAPGAFLITSGPHAITMVGG